MKSYDFNTSFSPPEFQNFARDMVQIKENIFIESFAEGRDMGIDGRFVAEDGYTIIFQAKQLQNAGKDIRKVMREEKDKLDRLTGAGERVDRYILAISGDLLTETKEKVYQFFSPYIINPQDILTKSDFNNLLGDKKYHAVEDKYYQLRIPSANVLRKKLFEVVNSALLHQSIVHYEEALEKRNVFVETAVFKEAVSQLQRNRAIIISGEPGVGKTTLAEQIALYYFAKYRFQAFVYTSSVKDLYTALEIEGKKVILYDDFWGSNGLDKFDGVRQSKELVAFIDYIRKNKDCLLVMTTREYILEQGLKENEELRRLLEEYKLECRITQYSDADKLQIYYGHLKHAGLTWEQTKALQRNEHRVISSRNYNPRVIELFTKSITVDMSPNECVAAFDRYLKCPLDFWKKIFNDLSQEAKILYVLTLILPMPIEVEILKKCYTNSLKIFENTFEWKEFSDIIIELEKTVLRTDLYNENGARTLTVTFQNPSAKDFLITLMKDNFEKYHPILSASCQYYAQYVEYLKLLDEIAAPSEVYAEIFKKAMNAISSESISFYDKYKVVLRFNKELGKYYERYATEQDYHDIGFGRFFQLLSLYKHRCGEDVREKIRTLFLSLMHKVEAYPELVLNEDLQVFPEVMIAVYQSKIYNHIFEMLKIYMEILMRNRKPIDDRRIKAAFPDIWGKYVKQYKKQIAGYLEKYYEAELCLAAVAGDGVDFAYQYSCCEECYEMYDIDIPEELHRKIKLYDTWVTESEDAEEKEEWEYDERIQSVREIRKDFKENFLELILPTRVEDAEQWIEMRTVSPEIKEILRQANERVHIFWNQFTEDEESLEFLEAFVIYTGRLPEKMAEIFSTITGYIEEKSGLTKGNFLKFIALLEGEENRVWSKAEIEELCSDFFFENECFLESLVEAKILVNRNHWYRVSNGLLIFCTGMEPYTSNTEKRQGYYRSVGEQVTNQKICRKDRLFWESLYQLDPECYLECILIPAAHSLYGAMPRDEASCTKALLYFLDIEFEFEDEEIVGERYDADIFFDILEVYLDVDLMELLSPDFTEEQILLLKDAGVLGKEKQMATLQELEEHGLLADLKISDKLEMLWKQICRWQTEV